MFVKVSAVAVCGVLVSVLLGGGVAGAASDAGKASRAVLQDGRGDVWLDTRGGEGPGTDVPSELPQADVVRAEAMHGRHMIRARMRFVDLRRSGTQEYQFFLEPAGAHDWLDSYFVEVISRPGHRAGSQSIATIDSTVRCPRMRHRIDFRADVVSVRVPRSCIKRPRWVKVHFDNRFWVGGHMGVGYFTDNPHNHRATSVAATNRLYPR